MGNRLVLHHDECDKVFFPERSRFVLPDPSVLPQVNQNRDESLPAEPVAADPSPQQQSNFHRLLHDFVTLPHQFSHSWWHVIIIFMSLTIGTLLLHAGIFFMPLSNVNDGLASNRGFLYGVQTHVELISLLPWVETVNFAIPSAEISLRSRLVAFGVGMVVAKFFDAFIAEGWWGFGSGADPVFPIPFSTIVSLTLSLPFSLATLFYMTPKRHEPLVRGKFGLCYKVLAYYLGCVFCAGCWAVGMRYLLDKKILQFFWAFMFQPIQLVCKIYFMSDVLLKLNPRRWVPMVIVVDVIFGRMQVATLPYFGGFSTVIAVVGGTFFSLVWRFYSGVDRIALLWSRLTGKKKKELDREFGLHGARQGLQASIRLPHRVMRASLKDIHMISMRLHGNNGVNAWGDYSDDDDSSSDDSSTHSTLGKFKTPDSKNMSNVTEETDIVSDDEASVISVHLSGDDEEAVDLETGDRAEHKDNDIPAPSTPRQIIPALTEPVEQEERDDEKSVSDSEPAAHPTIKSCVKLATSPRRKSVRLPNRKLARVASLNDQRSNSTGSLQDIELGSPDSREQQQKQHETDTPVQDRRRLFQLGRFFKSPNMENHHHSKLTEVDWEQRQMFHVVDSIGSEVLLTIVRIHHMVAIGLVRNLPISQHLNRTFEITDEQWRKANIYGWTFVLANILVLLTLSLAFRKIQQELSSDRKLTLNRVLTYLFRNHFWFFFLWLSMTGALACSTMINHFGADFRLTFKWLTCRGDGRMDWPGCMAY